MATVLPTRAQTDSTGSSSGASTHPSSQPSFSSFPSRHRSTSQSSEQSLAPQHGRNFSVSRHTKSTATSNTHPSDGASQTQGPVKALPKPSYKPVKSQYPSPRSSTEKHVEYILVASFDIDRGSIMEHQYPAPVGGDEHMLAELMLPDQAHVRSQDWTVFFLHKDVSAEDEDEEDDSASTRRRKRRRRRRRAAQEGGQAEAGADDAEDEGSEEDSSGDEDTESDISDLATDGPPLVYVLNLVNTKHESTVKRGAIVKAMAICTRHSFLHIYKPLLLLALEQYFAAPVPETLATLYDAVNSMDLSLIPQLNSFERFILQSSDAKDMFVEKFEAIIAQRMAEKERQESNVSIDTAEPASPTSGPRSRYGLPRDTHEFESVVRYHNVPVPVKIPTALAAETVGDFSLIKLITTFSTPHSTNPIPFSPTHPHLTTNGPTTHPIIVLINALLTQKRVIFLGHNLPSSSVAEAVLAACSLASGGFLRGFTRHAFPYTDLTKIDDLLKVPGFIAGVTNPAFGHHAEWWDVLCDLSTGRVKISAKIEMPPLTEGVVFFQNNNAAVPSSSATAATSHASASNNTNNPAPTSTANSAFLTGNTTGDATGDAAFMTQVLLAIASRVGENAIRSKFRLWVLKFTRLAAAFEEAVYGATNLAIQPLSPNPTTPLFTPNPTSPLSPSTTDPHAFHSSAAQTQPGHGHGFIWPTPQSKTAELAANATRIEGWRTTRSYYNFIQDLALHFPQQPVKELDLQHLHDKLAKLRLPASQPAGGESAEGVYLAVCAAVRSSAEVTQLLSVVVNSACLPSGGGGGPGAAAGSAAGGAGGEGLFYLALGLLHPKREVREAVAGLLGRVREHEAGRHFWAGLGRFMRGVWGRVVQGMEVDGEEGEG